ncbi:hypothetical protein [Demequina litorisediminis]|uniref:Uncharacterized protein n=1 Tax=Demequina litorisediminis TaxID=1849022 RepID=A0ABQ6IKR9_9MICO|nr:hypothetical protein [Demequina litorisediminis]GMA37802.1 hypothetical protein GCM10025876_40060 [Demequina litorisediminis]GMA37935.1 hypothetical protein GCM10025876_41390 [Demequina litorisediminis]
MTSNNSETSPAPKPRLTRRRVALVAAAATGVLAFAGGGVAWGAHRAAEADAAAALDACTAAASDLATLAGRAAEAAKAGADTTVDAAELESTLAIARGLLEEACDGGGSASARTTALEGAAQARLDAASTLEGATDEFETATAAWVHDDARTTWEDVVSQWDEASEKARTLVKDVGEDVKKPATVTAVTKHLSAGDTIADALSDDADATEISAHTKDLEAAIDEPRTADRGAVEVSPGLERRKGQG